jgi:hypothetical protein
MSNILDHYINTEHKKNLSELTHMNGRNDWSQRLFTLCIEIEWNMDKL